MQQDHGWSWDNIDWSATGTMIGAIVAAVFGVSGFVLGLLSYFKASRSTEAAVTSAAAAVTSAAAAETSARSAADSAREAKRVADVEVQRDHRDLDPMPTVVFKAERKRQGEDIADLWATVTVHTTCRLSVEAVQGKGRQQLVPDKLVAPLEPLRFPVEQMPDVHGTVRTDSLEVRVWPPRGDDPVEVWSCPCDRPAHRVDEKTPGHWERTIPVRDVGRPRKVIVGGRG
jgi:Tfp pilus assembly protein PilV